jgi:hypothetical protein
MKIITIALLASLASSALTIDELNKLGIIPTKTLKPTSFNAKGHHEYE